VTLRFIIPGEAKLIQSQGTPGNWQVLELSELVSFKEIRFVCDRAGSYLYVK
jgi:hypothetical protein